MRCKDFFFGALVRIFYLQYKEPYDAASFVLLCSPTVCVCLCWCVLKMLSETHHNTWHITGKHVKGRHSGIIEIQRLRRHGETDI